MNHIYIYITIGCHRPRHDPCIITAGYRHLGIWHHVVVAPCTGSAMARHHLDPQHHGVEDQSVGDENQSVGDANEDQSAGTNKYINK